MAISRRSFLKGTTATTMAMALSEQIAGKVMAAPLSGSMTPGPGNKWPGRVVVNFNQSAIQGTSTVVAAAAKQMVDDSIIKLTGETTVGAAWKAVFPSTLTAQSKIAIKVYCANEKIPTHWQCIQAITEGLQKMDFSGAAVPAANISIYEGNASNHLAQAGFTAANFPGVKIEYWTKGQFAGGSGNEAAGVIKDRNYVPTLKNADFLINVFNPHGHSPEFGSFSIGFKNHYGTYDLYNPSDIHGSNGSQYLRDMNSTGPIFKKTVLSVCCGMVGMNETIGPMGSPQDFSNYVKTMDPASTCQCPATVIMSTDPISCEMQTIKMMRLNKSGKYGISDMPNYLKASAGVDGALTGTVYNIGVIDETKMDIRRIINGTTSVSTHPDPTGKLNLPSLVVSSMPQRASSFIEYRLPADCIGQKAVVAVYALDGALVREAVQPVLGALNHFAWDNRDGSGHMVRTGHYVARLTSGKVSLATHFTVGN